MFKKILKMAVDIAAIPLEVIADKVVEEKERYF